MDIAHRNFLRGPLPPSPASPKRIDGTASRTFVFIEVPDADTVQSAMGERGGIIRSACWPWPQYSRVGTGRLEGVARHPAVLPELINGLGAA